jgi:cytochrome c oxidase assembly protein subunit 15
VAATAVIALAAALWRRPEAGARRFGALLAFLLLWQLASGLSNVVLGWPIAAALAHSAGAAALVGGLTALWARLHAAAGPAAAPVALSGGTPDRRPHGADDARPA